MENGCCLTFLDDMMMMRDKEIVQLEGLIDWISTLGKRLREKCHSTLTNIRGKSRLLLSLHHVYVLLYLSISKDIYIHTYLTLSSAPNDLALTRNIQLTHLPTLALFITALWFTPVLTATSLKLFAPS